MNICKGHLAGQAFAKSLIAFYRTVHEVNYLNHNFFVVVVFFFFELNVNTASSNFCHKNVYQATFPTFDRHYLNQRIAIITGLELFSIPQNQFEN